MDIAWQKKIEEYCEKYNIPLLYLADTMLEPKVIPMIRGKAFEFSVMLKLKEVLPPEEWEVSKPPMNAQLGLHDIDVRVFHKPSKKIIRVECKLAKKGGYRLFPDGHSEIRVKCMRSRTLGPGKIKELAPKLGVNEKVLAVHNDQYLPSDFDVVITSIGNAFYDTDKKTGLFEWVPKKNGEEFLKKFYPDKIENLQSFGFRKMYASKTESLTIGHTSGVVCTRAKCKNKKDCNFIPNYPIINFDTKTNQPINKWVDLDDCLSLFQSFVDKR